MAGMLQPGKCPCRHVQWPAFYLRIFDLSLPTHHHNLFWFVYFVFSSLTGWLRDSLGFESDKTHTIVRVVCIHTDFVGCLLVLKAFGMTPAPNVCAITCYPAFRLSVMVVLPCVASSLLNKDTVPWSLLKMLWSRAADQIFLYATLLRLERNHCGACGWRSLILEYD